MCAVRECVCLCACSPARVCVCVCVRRRKALSKETQHKHEWMFVCAAAFIPLYQWKVKAAPLTLVNRLFASFGLNPDLFLCSAEKKKIFVGSLFVLLFNTATLLLSIINKLS